MSKRNAETLNGLPEVKEAGKAVRGELKALLHEAHSLRELKKRFEQVKDRIVEIVQEEGLVDDLGRFGARDGILCVIVSEQQGKEMLKRELLIENGVSPDVITRSTERGKPFQVCELQEIED